MSDDALWPNEWPPPDAPMSFRWTRIVAAIMAVCASFLGATLLVLTFTHGPLLPRFSASQPLVLATAAALVACFGVAGGLAARFLIGLRVRGAVLTVGLLCAAASAAPIGFWAMFANLRFDLG